MGNNLSDVYYQWKLGQIIDTMVHYCSTYRQCQLDMNNIWPEKCKGTRFSNARILSFHRKFKSSNIIKMIDKLGNKPYKQIKLQNLQSSYQNMVKHAKNYSI